MFMAQPFGFNAEVATCLAQLCTNDQCLPQGAPTSPAISNIITRELDRRVKAECRRSKCDYTRYADDLCISSNMKDVPDSLAVEQGGVWVAGPGILAAVTASGFEINPDKTKVKFQRDRQMVTGLVVNRHVALPRAWRRQLRVILHLRKKHGDVRAMSIVKTWARNGIRRKAPKSVDPLISGKAGFAAFVERDRYPSYTRSIFYGYPGSRHLIPKPYRAYPFRVLTEGVTDVAHLAAAFRHFSSRGLFTHLAPTFPKLKFASSSSALLGELSRIAKSVSTELTIGVLDFDEPELIRQKNLEPGEFIHLGGSTYVLCLGRPSWVDGAFCVEDLYRWEQAGAFHDERRLFKMAEFGDDGYTEDRLYLHDGKKKDAIYVTDHVVRVHDKAPSLLSKQKFSQLITAEVEPFAEMDFDGFGATFAGFGRIIEHYLAG